MGANESGSAGVAPAKLLLAGLFLLGVVLLQWHFLAGKVRTVDAEPFSARAVDIHQDDDWRYGYMRGMHGAELVRTAAGAADLQAREEEEIPGLTAFMTQQLRLLRWKAAGEVVLYGMVFASLVWILPGLYRRRVARRGFASAFRWYGAGWMLAVGLFLLPMWLLGYGLPLYSTWQGPAPDVFSIFLRWTGTSGLTVSYRPVAEAVFLWPGRLALWTGMFGRLPEVSWPTALWLMAAPIYGLVGAGLGAAIVAVRERSDTRP